MTAFVYDGSVAGHAVWRVLGRDFLAGVPVEVTEAQACKLRCLPYFSEFSAIAEAGEQNAAATVVYEPPSVPLVAGVVPTKRGRGRPPGSKNKPKVTDGDQDAG